MFTQTSTTFVMVSQEAEKVMALGRKYHWRFRIVTDFQGVIDRPVFSSRGDWIYIPKRKEDEAIIPNAALRRHKALEKAGFRIAQVIIGHEVEVAPEEPTTLPQTVPEIDWGKVKVTPELPAAPSKPKPDIDWKKVAEFVGKGVLVGMMGITMISFYALTGLFPLIDPSYCIVLEDGAGTVVELMRWNTEA